MLCRGCLGNIGEATYSEYVKRCSVPVNLSSARVMEGYQRAVIATPVSSSLGP